MIRTIVVDDEKNGRENLKGFLDTYCKEVAVIAEACSATDAIRLIEKLRPDLLFLDIEMPEGNGFEVLRHFDDPSFQVIFVTAYNQYAIQAIRFSALDYLLKPINIIELQAAVKRFNKQNHDYFKQIELFKSNYFQPSSEKKIALTFADKIEFVSIPRIIKCKGEGSYTHFFTEDGKEFIASKPLSEFEKLLKDFHFARTHKAWVVNVSHVESFIKTEGGHLKMTDGTIVPVSRRKKDTVLAILGKK